MRGGSRPRLYPLCVLCFPTRVSSCGFFNPRAREANGSTNDRVGRQAARETAKKTRNAYADMGATRVVAKCGVTVAAARAGVNHSFILMQKRPNKHFLNGRVKRLSRADILKRDGLPTGPATPPRPMPRRETDDDDPGALWDALGRGTAAGRVVFNLYSGDTSGRQYGAFATGFNRLKMKTSDPAERRAPPDVEQSLKKQDAIACAARSAHARVRRPGNFTGKEPVTEAQAVDEMFEEAKKNYRPTVRPKAVSELENIARREEKINPPAPSRRLIGEEGKLRLQRLREFNGKLPEEQAWVKPVTKRDEAKTERNMNTKAQAEVLFSQVVAEIEERETFLADMTRAGRGQQYETAIKAEIGERVRTLKKLDVTIRREEDAGR